MKEKLEYITNLRFPLILGVVLDHASVLSIPSILRGDDFPSDMFRLLQVLLKISVPVFFIISGFLFFKNVKSFHVEEYIGKLRARLHTLVIPYFLWTVIFFLYISLRHIPVILSSGSIDSIKDMFTFQIFWMYKSGLPLHFSLWYVRDLIVLSLISPVIWILLSRWKHFAMLLIFVLYMMHDIDPQISFPISFFYFSLGSYLAICHLDIRPISNKLGWSILIVMIVAAICSILGNVTLARFCHIIFAVSYIALSAFVTDRCKKCIPKRLTECVFFIYAAHTMAFFTVCHSLYSHFIPDDAVLALLFIRLFLVGLTATFLCVLFYHVLHRFFPRMVAILTGGR